MDNQNETKTKEFSEQQYYIEKLKAENDEYYARTGRRKKHLTLTFGCAMNEKDSEQMESILKDIGYETTDNKQEADLILINTCLVRENAELKVYGKVGALKHLKIENPDLIIGICGCMMQKQEAREVIEKKHSFVDLIFGTHNIHKLPELLHNSYNQKKMVIDVWEDKKNVVEGFSSYRKYKHKALVNITYGCNNFCTYCIVPYTRGREKSREVADIVAEIERLVADGCLEVTLLGQNVNSYGKTLEKKVTFAELLREVDKIEGLERVRFMTSHPKDLSDDLIEAIADCDSLCEHIHLPFQAGNDRVLKSMNRKYTKEEYLELAKKIRYRIPNISITTDIIVGFPGETYEEFKDTIDVVQKVKFDSAFTFLYSIREGTPAAEMTDQIPEDEKNQRFQELLDTLNPIVLENNKKIVGNIESVLVEGTSKNKDDILVGRTRGFKLVHFKGDESLVGQIVDIKISEAKTWSVFGELIGAGGLE